MAETIPDLRNVPKPRAYAELKGHSDAILEGITDEVAAMATLAALIHHAFGHLWTGFYRVIIPGQLLRVGPYQGSLGCLDIAFGRGVCGTAAAEMKTVIVPDVDKFPGHIACDARARSEIVVPVLNRRGDLIAVLDVDSDRLDAFKMEDQQGLERIVSWFATMQE
ncbi:MAG TPA: GAF domain-containing protein [Gemmatimonadaceae bacterium]|jgi:L-methionine (R)-S-oxide reductase|nr:GAF domain-containing protein [Gemmatimonadaceae bacterium]